MIIIKNNINKDIKKNYILAEINIKEDGDINKDIRIINSFEDCKRMNNWKNEENDYIYVNEEEIKENCVIKINNNMIPLIYLYQFKEKGKFIIEYSFKNNIKNTDFMFYKCNSLTKFDLSDFNTQNATEMSYMFTGCSG